jgi:hypothetical protein
MAKNIVDISNSLKRIDITCLVKYNSKIKDIGNLSKMEASHYMRDFIDAMDITNLMLMNAMKLDIDAKTALDTAEAIAYLDKATPFLKERGTKESDGSRRMYVDIDEDVIKAKETKAKTEALVSFLKNKLQIFRYCHDDVKKIGYADQQMTGFEGF